jgi:hypothetical protein
MRDVFVVEGMEVLIIIYLSCAFQEVPEYIDGVIVCTMQPYAKFCCAVNRTCDSY